MARRLIRTGLGPGGAPSRPRRKALWVGEMPPDKGRQSRNIGPTYYKGETIKFNLDRPPEGRVRKLTVGPVMDDESTIFEESVLPGGGGRATVALPWVDTTALEAGLYLWDLFEMDPDGRGRALVNCGTFQLKETVGARTVASDPTERP